MIEKIYESEFTPYESELYLRYFKGMKTGFFDIETTGFSPDKSRIILSGIAIPDGDRLISKQFLAEDPSEEPFVIRRTLEELDALDTIVTYNGRRFDIPFLEKRLLKNKIHFSRPLPYNLDLLMAVKYASPLKDFLPDLKQKTVERFLGLDTTRTDEISGGDSVELYFIYAGTKDEKLRDVILLHNLDDIRQLAKLPEILDRCNLHQTLFRVGMPCSSSYIDQIELKKTALLLKGQQRVNPVNGTWYDDFASGIQAQFDETARSFAIEIPLLSESGFLLADLSRMPMDLSSFEDSPYYAEGYLILQERKQIHYELVNQLSIAITEYIDHKFREQ